MIEEAAATVAHEYQHLIQAGYEGEERETTFISEGLSEYAEILCGFAPRPADAYFRDPTRPLLSWNYAKPIPDYARASLFIHYLFERVGAKYAKALVQSTQTGLAGIRSVLQAAGGPSFERLFREWGLALFLNDRSTDPAYGYEHPARQNISFGDGTSFSSLPGLRVGTLGALSHVPARVPLVSTLQVEARSDDEVTVAAEVTYPDGEGRVDPRVRAGERLHARQGSYGSVRMLASNVSARPVSGRTRVELLAHGTRSAQRRTLAYDDGKADAFRGNASYFLLERPGESMALAFGPDEPGWLFGIRADVLFLSEIAGSSVPRSAPREVDVRICRVDGGRVGAPITEWHETAVRRGFGALKAAAISLRHEVDALRAVQDSFAVVLRSARPTDNPVAVAMDRTEDAETAGAAFHRSRAEASRQPVETVQVEGGATLEGFRPILQARMAVAETRIDASALDLRFAHAREQVFVRVDAPFPVDSSRAQLTVQMPAGRYVQGEVAEASTVPEELEQEPGRVTFALPLEVGSAYSVYARVESPGGSVGRKHVRWTPPVDRIAIVGRPAPNPTRRQAQFSVRLREAGRIQPVVYDVLGRRIQMGEVRRWDDGRHRLRVDLRDEAAGTYVVRFRIRRERDGYVTEASRKVVKVE